MRYLATLFILSAGLAFAQQDHDAMLNQHGDHVMGFSQEKTTHHFELTQDGGSIEVRDNDIDDVASRDEIQKHFHHIVQMFAAGNFSAPMLVHARPDVPGTATMTALKSKLHWQLQETARGAKLTVVADNKEALDAVHDFLRFQITDHQTGDCTAVR
jgi:hypothetical protein